MVALHIGPRRNLAPADRTPWRLLRLGGYIFIFVSLIRGIWPATVASPPTSLTLIPDTLILPAYLCVGYAYMVMLRRRRAGDDDPARVDAVLVGLPGAFLTWTFLIGPAVTSARLLSLVQIVDALFPVIDVVLLVLVAQMMLAGGSRTPSLRLLIVGTVAMFGADLVFCLRDVQLLDLPQQYVDALFLVMFVLMPAAALHPSTRALVEAQRVMSRTVTRCASTSARVAVQRGRRHQHEHHQEQRVHVLLGQVEQLHVAQAEHQVGAEHRDGADDQQPQRRRPRAAGQHHLGDQDQQHHVDDREQRVDDLHRGQQAGRGDRRADQERPGEDAPASPTRTASTRAGSSSPARRRRSITMYA